jgi:hypothetical protein
MIKEEIQPELSDILEMIHRYCSANKNEVSFIGSFIGFKEDPTRKCAECGDNCDSVDDKKSRVFAYGDLETLRILNNELRDIIEDESDEDGFVSI